MDSVFTMMLQGKIPYRPLYEDADVFAILDKYPLSYGHLLVIPKKQVARFDELDPHTAGALGKAVALMAGALVQIGVKDYNVLQNNGASAHQAIFHVHVHIIPKNEHGLELVWRPVAIETAGLEEKLLASLRK